MRESLPVQSLRAQPFSATVRRVGPATNDRRLVAEIGSLLARSRRGVFQRARRKLEAVGESIFVWRVLAYLHDEGPAFQAELADATAQHPASTSRLLDQMEAASLVSRSRDGDDRRRVRVALTSIGKQKYLALYDQVLEVLEEALAPLAADEQKALATLLAKMIGAR